ncbi:MAG: S-ribosylhomocysteine lyase [Ruminococcaceae bacterium]|nr:S-ribosylhomocysteine lyase [Oscillospiraceae bacterium]
MKKIASFTVDHNKLNVGVYISRIDSDIVTYDLRFIKPNTPPFLDPLAMHTIEHLFATYARNSEYSENVIYFGPMGCMTGFYFLTRELSHETALSLIKDIVKKCRDHEGDIPGNSKIECGNFLAHNVEKAHKALFKYYNDIKDWTVEKLSYDYFA